MIILMMIINMLLTRFINDKDNTNTTPITTENIANSKVNDSNNALINKMIITTTTAVQLLLLLRPRR